MITADTSALVSVVLGEEDAESMLRALTAEEVQVSAVSLVEAGLVVEGRHGPDATRDLDQLVRAVVAHVAPADELTARAAIAAWRRFGRGRHPASLNFGDCFSYATATLSGTPLLFKGHDFSQTDVRQAPA